MQQIRMNVFSVDILDITFTHMALQELAVEPLPQAIEYFKERKLNMNQQLKRHKLNQKYQFGVNVKNLD